MYIGGARYYRPAQHGMWNVGTLIEGYVLVQRLGRGGFGEVWEAYHQDRRDTVAIKLLHPEFCEPGTGPGATFAERFIYEANVLRRLDHPGIVSIEAVIDRREEELLAYVMERLHGSTLDDLKTELDTGILLHCFRRVSEALGHLHEHDIVHRDVKSTNIFVCQPDETGKQAIKLIDLGVAKGLDSNVKTKTGVLVGTLKTMAPECFDALMGRAPPLNGSVDQWAMGVTIFRLMTGRMPFGGSRLLEVMQAIQTNPIPDLPLLPQYRTNPHAHALMQVVHRCLQKNPKDRYPDLHAVAEVLHRMEVKVRGNDSLKSEDSLTNLETRADSATNPEGNILTEFDLESLKDAEGGTDSVALVMLDDGDDTVDYTPLRSTPLDPKLNAPTIASIEEPIRQGETPLPVDDADRETIVAPSEERHIPLLRSDTIPNPIEQTMPGDSGSTPQVVPMNASPPAVEDPSNPPGRLFSLGGTGSDTQLVPALRLFPEEELAELPSPDHRSDSEPTTPPKIPPPPVVRNAAAPPTTTPKRSSLESVVVWLLVGLLAAGAFLVGLLIR